MRALFGLSIGPGYTAGALGHDQGEDPTTRTGGTAAITVHMPTQKEASASPPAMATDLMAAMRTITTGQTALMDKIYHLQANVD